MAYDQISTVGSREGRLASFVDEMRADAATGLHFDPDPIETEHFQGLRGLAAKLFSYVDTRGEAEISRIFAEDSVARTPLLGVALVLNDQRRGPLLVRDNDTVAVPYRPVGVDEDHESAARKLVRGVIHDDEVVPLAHGICDSISAGLAMPHTYFLIYAIDVTLVDPQAIDAELLAESDVDVEQLDALTRFLFGGAPRDVLDSAFALTRETRQIVTQVRDLTSAAADTAANPYSLERFTRTTETAEAILAGVDSPNELVPGSFSWLDVRTPLVGAETIILDRNSRILLMRRADNGKWAMPGGMCEVGETSAATVVREAREEVNIDIAVDGLAGVFDARLIDGPQVLCPTCFVYIAHPENETESPQPSLEAIEVKWCEREELADLDLWEGHRTKIAAALQAVTG